jgi:hypothetical protein
MSTKVADLDEKRNQRRVTDTLNNLLKDAQRQVEMRSYSFVLQGWLK